MEEKKSNAKKVISSNTGVKNKLKGKVSAKHKVKKTKTENQNEDNNKIFHKFSLGALKSFFDIKNNKDIY